MTDTDHNPPFFDLVGNIRAMRRLKPDPVPFELIEKVLTAGVQAPSIPECRTCCWPAAPSGSARTW